MQLQSCAISPEGGQTRFNQIKNLFGARQLWQKKRTPTNISTDKSECPFLLPFLLFFAPLEQARFEGHQDIVSLLEKHMPSRGPDSLLNIARACIRTRLIERQRDGGSIAEIFGSRVAAAHIAQGIRLRSSDPGGFARRSL